MPLAEVVDTIVIGAGVVGLSVGTNLARRGVEVAILDELPPASGASYGNSGFLVADTAMPVALPGMYKKVPTWLADPEGPLRVRPGYLPKALPFLMKWLLSSRASQVVASSDAMRKLHEATFDEWMTLVGPQVYDTLIRRTGQVYLWESEGKSTSTPTEDLLRERHGVKVQPLTVGEIRAIYPGITPAIKRAMLIPGNGHTTNPGRLCAELLQVYLNAGGVVSQERVQRMWQADGLWQLMTTSGQRRTAKRIVVAAGAWSHRLLAPLGIDVPLESERGYHVVLPDPSVQLAMPILHKTGYFGVNSMEVGLRLAGTVEISGLEAPPDPRRCSVLVRKAKQLFPSLRHGEPRIWMGHRPSVPNTVPVIGPVPTHRGLFTCFGHGHCGLTAGPASGKLVVQQMMGEPTGFDTKPYAIDRFMR